MVNLGFQGGSSEHSSGGPRCLTVTFRIQRSAHLECKTVRGPRAEGPSVHAHALYTLYPTPKRQLICLAENSQPLGVKLDRARKVR